MREFLEQLIDRRDLTEEEAAALLVALSSEQTPAAAAGGVLAALRAKGETAEEVRGFAKAMRRLALRPEIPGREGAVDVVGTGGDGSGSLNLSTGAALLAAACGQPVIKHGNRAQSSRCGSADVLEALGMELPPDGRAARQWFEKTGFTFLFAPHFHPALRTLGPVRRSLGVPTVFNILGPLSNPVEPPFLLVGAFSAPAAELIARALSGLPIRRAFVVHGANGWDEPTPLGPFLLFDVTAGRVLAGRRDPAELGLPRRSAEELRGGDARENARSLREALSGEPGAHADSLRLGAALAMEVTGLVATTGEGLDLASSAIASGAASRLVERLTAGSTGDGEEHG